MGLSFVSSSDAKAKVEIKAGIDWVLENLVDLADLLVKHGISLDESTEKILESAHAALVKEKEKLGAPKAPPPFDPVASDSTGIYSAMKSGNA